MADKESDFRFGYVALVGKPNVGKSTLLNQFIGQKISIVTRKPQTTRQRILGIKTIDRGQIVYVDTPGIHQAANKALNRYMNRVAFAVLRDIDVVAFLVEAGRWTDADERVRNAVFKTGRPVFLVVNKIDEVNDKGSLLPFVKKISDQQPFAGTFMISALKGHGVPDLEQAIFDSLPFSQPFYDQDQITDRSERFLAAELIREQLTVRLHQELPYTLSVTIESFNRDKKLLRISAIIWVEREGQKQIVIGRKGEVLKQVGAEARQALQELLGEQVFLQLWVKVKRGWTDSEAALSRMGFDYP